MNAGRGTYRRRTKRDNDTKYEKSRMMFRPDTPCYGEGYSKLLPTVGVTAQFEDEECEKVRSHSTRVLDLVCPNEYDTFKLCEKRR